MSEAKNEVQPKASLERVVSVRLDVVYTGLICEFDHYDICLVGLTKINGIMWLCNAISEYYAKNPRYELRRVDWDSECDEYLNDYRATYHHWFWNDGHRDYYDGRDLSGLSRKWGGRNPIVERAH